MKADKNSNDNVIYVIRRENGIRIDLVCSSPRSLAAACPETYRSAVKRFHDKHLLKENGESESRDNSTCLGYFSLAINDERIIAYRDNAHYNVKAFINPTYRYAKEGRLEDPSSWGFVMHCDSRAISALFYELGVERARHCVYRAVYEKGRINIFFKEKLKIRGNV